jgi:hypothetical protein
VELEQVHSAAAATGVETGSGPLEDSLPSFIAQTFQERYKACSLCTILCCTHCLLLSACLLPTYQELDQHGMSSAPLREFTIQYTSCSGS